MVYLVGAGPGDLGLMTSRAIELIAAADAILYDRLVPPGALDGARPDAELRYVGKEPGRAAVAAHALVAHPLREAAPRMLGQQSRESLIQTQSGALGRHDELAGGEW